jgi:hypothetical protein
VHQHDAQQENIKMSGLTEEQRRELENLRMMHAMDRRERENSQHTTSRLTAIGTLAAAVIAFGAFLFSITKNDAAPTPAINITNTNGDNNKTGGDIVNGDKTVTRQGISTDTSVNIPSAAPAPTKVKEPSRPAAAVSDYKKYIDSNVHRMAGTTNVAIALRGLPGFPPGALESAVQRALRERGFRIVPIFRNQFREDEAELRLFNGDASFANRLKLREHCDRVLLGVLRFAGPAQVVDGGLYIREAVLEIRALDPSTGLVVDSLEISEKGGGTTAELSAIDAVSRLKESVLANISGWSWV